MFRKYRITHISKRISHNRRRLLIRQYREYRVSDLKNFCNYTKFQYGQLLNHEINKIKDLNHKIKIIKKSVFPYYWTVYCEICNIATDAIIFESSGGSFPHFEGTCNEYVMHKILA